MKYEVDLTTVLALVIGGVIGFYSSYLMWTVQMKHDREKIARAFYAEISSLETTLKAYSGLFTKDINGVSGHTTPIEIKQPFYSNGIFFDLRKEIFSFNPESSKDLFEFYMHLLRAEEFRQIDHSNVLFKPLNTEMKMNIVKAYELLPHLKELLKRESS